MRNKIHVVIGIVFSCLVCMIILQQVKISNYKAFEMKLKNTEELFHGVFNTYIGHNNVDAATKGTDICVYFVNDCPEYDEKALVFEDNEKGKAQEFNTYFIKSPQDTLYDKKTKEFKTTWFLCKYDGVNSILLLDKNNKLVGRIAVMPGGADWLGRVELQYYWIKDEKIIQVFKRSAQPYSAGTSYLESKYYSGLL